MAVDTAVPEISDIDLFSDEVMADPHETWRRLREAGPAVHLPTHDLWAIARYEDVRAALADPETFSSAQVAFNPQMNEVLQGTSLASDPPEHTKLRAVLSENLSPRALRSTKGRIDARADEMVRELAARSSFDGMADFANAVPVAIVADLIGIKEAGVREKMLAWGDAAMNCLGPMNERTGASFPLAGELFGWSHNIQASQLEEGSLGHAIFAAAERGEIAHESCGMIIHQYVAAGMDTTIASLGNALVLLAEHPEAYQALRQDPSLVSAVFAEVQRLQAPFPAAGRVTTRDVELGEVTIPKGAQVALLLGSGNRDERHYPNPDDFDITRNPTDHLAFGYGIHGCAGQGLARLEANAALTALAKYVESYRVGQTTRKLNNATRSFRTIEVLDVAPAPAAASS